MKTIEKPPKNRTPRAAAGPSPARLGLGDGHAAAFVVDLDRLVAQDRLVRHRVQRCALDTRAVAVAVEENV